MTTPDSTPPDSIAALRASIGDLRPGNDATEAEARARQEILTKPAGSLGRLEEIACWLACWQGRAIPRLDRVEVLIFAGNHGVVAEGVAAYPAAVTAQMVANFAAHGAAINQLAEIAGAELRVFPLALETPTANFMHAPAMDEADFLAAVAAGMAAVAPEADLICLGEMGIGNTTAAAAIAAALFGGGGARWAGRGAGVDAAGVARKSAVIDAALARHAGDLADPLAAARLVGGRELAAILGAALAARRLGVPVLLDGFVCTAAAAPLARLNPRALDHALIAHASAEAGHRLLVEALDKRPLLDFAMRLGEGSGAALAVPLLRAACACHAGMATFAEAGVANKT